MNIKPLFILLALGIAGTSTTMAQSSNVKKAKTNLVNFQKMKEANSTELGLPSLKSAAEAIDLAVENEKTKSDPEAWTIYSLVNANLADLQKSAELAAKAEKGIETAKSLDAKGENKENLHVAEQLLGQYNFNAGVGSYQENNFGEAYKSFDKALNYLPGDTTLLFYSGIAASQNKDYDGAIKKYLELYPNEKFSQRSSVVIDLPKFYLSKKDTASAIEYAKKATEIYPENAAAATQYIEYSLISGKEKEVIADITKQLEKNPNDKNLNYYLGIAQSSAKNDAAAIAAYKKAVEIDPNFFEANTNLAISMMNDSRAKLNVINNDRKLTQAQYNQKVDVIKNDLKTVLPFLTKAVEAKPDNYDALSNLKAYYSFMGDEAKVKELNEKLKTAK